MKNAIFVAVLLFSAGVAGPALAQAYEPIPATQSGPYMADPVPGTGADYPPSAATATEAYVGPPKDHPAEACSALSPCALASSAPRKLGTEVSSLR